MSAFENVGKALALMRERRGLSQDAVAKRMRTSHKSNVSAVENGSPNAATIDRYLDAIDADAYDLARALDEVRGQPPQGAAHALNLDAIRAAFPGAPRDLLARARVLLAEKEVADSKLDECLEEIRESATRGSA